MIQTKLFKQVCQTAALSMSRHKTEATDQLHITYLHHTQPVRGQFIQYRLHRNKRKHIRMEEIMFDALRTAQLHLNMQLPQR